MSFWARASSLVLSLAACTAAVGQSYGRFGGDGLPQPLGFHLAPEGFRIIDAPSDTFQFLTPLADIKVESRSDRHAEAICRPAEGVPSRVRVNLRSPGFEMLVKGRIVIKLSSLQNPFLTAEGATYGDGVPTPAAKWVLVSFQDQQPPLLISTSEVAELDWQIDGKPGEWTLRNLTDFQGWIRVSAPVGRTPLHLTTPEAMGSLMPILSREAAFWTEPTSRLISSSVTRHEASIQAIFNFDRLYSQLPPALLLSRTGGSGIDILSGISATSADFAEGPQGFSAEPRWVVRFPVRDILPGRALVNGELPAEASMEKHLLALFTSAGDPTAGKKIVLEAGDDLRSAARAAYAEMAMERWGWKPTREGASPLQKVLWSRDYSSLTLYGADAVECAEAAGWLMLGLASQSDPQLRLEGGLLWAGVTSQRALNEYRRKRGLGSIELKTAIPHPDVIASAYGQTLDAPSAGWEMLNSPVRVLSGQRITVNADVLDWRPVAGEGPVKIMAPESVVWKAVDGTKLTAEYTGSSWIIKAAPGAQGRCRVKAERLPILPDLR